MQRKLSSLCIRFVTTSLLFLLINVRAFSQDCPPNIDFETGTFNNWTCYTGTVSAPNGVNIISLNQVNSPLGNRHLMNTDYGTNERDMYGGFPVNCPNGSGHSIKLGNHLGGHEAEGISYEFTIPAGRDVYSLIYHYAVVFQDPQHQIFQQPRLEIEVKNMTDDVILYCSSFTFIPFGSGIPGFFQSPMFPGVWCKDWSAASANLDGLAGKNIRLFFKTADCAFRDHFGYAYIDVNSECGDFINGKYCAGDAFVKLTAPGGYETYTWFDSTFSQILSTSQTATLTPPPPVGTTIAVVVNPFNGYGCFDTIFKQLFDTMTVISNAGRDTFSCNGKPVPIGTNPKEKLKYSWSPVTGLSNANIANPRAGPLITTSYILTTSSEGGGCVDRDTVVVGASVIDLAIGVDNKLAFCITASDSAVLFVSPTEKIQWLRDNSPVTGQTGPRYRADRSGVYRALLINEKGCAELTEEKVVSIEIPAPGITYPIAFGFSNYPLQLKARAIGTSVQWRPPTFLNSAGSFAPVFTGTADKLYFIDIVSETGCVTVDTQLVKVVKDIKIYVPSGFTPNHDGLNDHLKPILLGIKELRYFRVYDRWGQLVYDSNKNGGAFPGWDGTIKGIPQSAQLVVWMAEGVGIDDKVYKEKGTSMLLR